MGIRIVLFNAEGKAYVAFFVEFADIQMKAPNQPDAGFPIGFYVIFAAADASRIGGGVIVGEP